MSTTTTVRAHATSRGGTSWQVAAWLAVMVLLWGLSWPAMKLALGSVPPLWLGTLRFASGSACLFVILAMRGDVRLPPKADWPIVVSVGGLQMMACTALGLTAMEYTDAGRAAVLSYSTPLWDVLVAWIFMGQRPSAAQGLALGVGLCGVAIICSPHELDWSNPNVVKGNLFLLLAAICWALVILHVRHHRFVSRPVDLAPWQMLLAAIPLGLAAIIWEGAPTHVHWTPELLSLVAYIGPVATSAYFVISTEYGRRIATFGMSNVTMGVPIVGYVSSVFLLGEHVSCAMTSGLVGGTVLAAIAAAQGRARTGR